MVVNFQKLGGVGILGPHNLITDHNQRGGHASRDEVVGEAQTNHYIAYIMIKI
jgi:hypothetical protein